MCFWLKNDQPIILPVLVRYRNSTCADRFFFSRKVESYWYFFQTSLPIYEIRTLMHRHCNGSVKRMNKVWHTHSSNGNKVLVKDVHFLVWRILAISCWKGAIDGFHFPFAESFILMMFTKGLFHHSLRPLCISFGIAASIATNSQQLTPSLPPHHPALLLRAREAARSFRPFVPVTKNSHLPKKLPCKLQDAAISRNEMLEDIGAQKRWI